MDTPPDPRVCRAILDSQHFASNSSKFLVCRDTPESRSAKLWVADLDTVASGQIGAIGDRYRFWSSVLRSGIGAQRPFVTQWRSLRAQQFRVNTSQQQKEVRPLPQ